MVHVARLEENTRRMFHEETECEGATDLPKSELARIETVELMRISNGHGCRTCASGDEFSSNAAVKRREPEARYYPIGLGELLTGFSGWAG